jgi:hypothetical protein
MAEKCQAPIATQQKQVTSGSLVGYYNSFLSKG